MASSDKANYAALKQVQQAIKMAKDRSDDILELQNFKIYAFTQEINKELQSLEELESLTIKGCKLQTLQNFPKLKVFHLILDNNQLTEADIGDLAHLRQLSILSLANNRIASLDSLRSLQRLEITELVLAGNPVTSEPKYRDKVFSILPSVSYVDNMDKDGKQIAEESSIDDDSDDDDDDLDDLDEEDDDEYEEEDYEGAGDSDADPDNFDAQSDQPKKKTKQK